MFDDIQTTYLYVHVMRGCELDIVVVIVPYSFAFSEVRLPVGLLNVLLFLVKILIPAIQPTDSAAQPAKVFAISLKQNT